MLTVNILISIEDVQYLPSNNLRVPANNLRLLIIFQQLPGNNLNLPAKVLSEL